MRSSTSFTVHRDLSDKTKLILGPQTPPCGLKGGGFSPPNFKITIARAILEFSRQYFSDYFSKIRKIEYVGPEDFVE